MNIFAQLGLVSPQNQKNLSREEVYLLDAMFLERMCHELTQILMEKYTMSLEKDVICLMLHDLISTEDYTIGGVAAYAHVPEEVVYDIAIGNITNPTLAVSRKIIKLHMGARPELYSHVMQKITESYRAGKGEK
jgi:hypothetical protein